MTTGATLVVRADGGPEIGMGHLMRCLALAQAWREAGGTCAWAGLDLPAAFEKRLAGEGIEAVALDAARGSTGDADALGALAQRKGADWIAVDGYRFASGYQKQIQDAGTPVLWVDDQGGADPFTADLVLNQNLGASADGYAQRAAHTRLLLGPEYVLLRREFRTRARAERTFDGPAPKIAVTLGGGDTRAPTVAVVNAVKDVAGVETRVIESVSDMAVALDWADVAITGAGSTVWEAAHLGVPMLLVVMGADQRGNARELERRGAAVGLGEIGTLDAALVRRTVESIVHDGARRRRMSEQGRALVDGAGVHRVLAAMGIGRAA
jgi:UDP-2,4-diacetamido-2,4,6-trideoxy-beta-L-altropyranose hydrolase